MPLLRKSSRGSRCPPRFKDSRQCLKKNIYIQPKRPVLNIFQVEFQPFFKGQIAAAGDLPDAGDARLDTEPFTLDAAIEQVDIALGHRPGADQAHLAAEDVDQLRQLIDTGFTEESARSGDSRVVFDLEDRPFRLVEMFDFGKSGLGIDMHRAELEHREDVFAQADPLLDEKDRAGGVEFDRQGDEEKERDEQGQGDNRAAQIKDPFGQQLLGILGDRFHRQQGDVPDHRQAYLGHLDVEHIGHEAEADALLFAGLDDRFGVFEQRAGNGNDHLVDDVFFQAVVDVFHGGDHRDPLNRRADQGGLGIDKADHIQAEDTMFPQGVHQIPGTGLGPDNQDPHRLFAAFDQFAVIGDGRQADQQQGGKFEQGKKQQDDPADILNVEKEQNDQQQADRGDQRPDN